MSHRHHKFCGCQPDQQRRSPWRPRPITFDWLTELARTRRNPHSWAYAHARHEAMQPSHGLAAADTRAQAAMYVTTCGFRTADFWRAGIRAIEGNMQ